MPQLQYPDDNKIGIDYLFAEISAGEFEFFFDTSVIRKKNKWYGFFISLLFFSFFLLLYFTDTTGKSLWELLPFFLLVCIAVYFYSRHLLNHFQFSPLKHRPSCHVDLQYVYLEFREPLWKKKLRIPIEQVQLIRGCICDDYLFRLTLCKNKNDEVLLLDFTFVNWQEFFNPAELVISSMIGTPQQRTSFFDTPRVVCCVDPTQFPAWFKRFPSPCSPIIDSQENSGSNSELDEN